MRTESLMRKMSRNTTNMPWSTFTEMKLTQKSTNKEITYESLSMNATPSFHRATLDSLSCFLPMNFKLFLIYFT